MDSTTHSVFFVRLRQRVIQGAIAAAFMLALACAAPGTPAFAEDSTTTPPTTPTTTPTGVFHRIDPETGPLPQANWGS